MVDDAAAVQQVRRFQRTVTQRVGALDEAYLARGRALGHSRVLWELGPDGADVRALRARLGLDSGYLSRVLHALESDGLVRVEPGSGDGRMRVARLTPLGLLERAELDARSDFAAAALLEPLSPTQRERLVSAMTQVDRLLKASAVEIGSRDPRDPVARFCLAAYVAELGRRFDTGFDPGRSLPASDDELSPPAGRFLVATLDGEAVGCAGLKLHGREPAEVKRMWVAEEVRGLGLGRRLLQVVEQHAAAAGAPALQLETNRALPEAIALYRSAGFLEVAPFSDEAYAHHWFRKDLAGS